MLWEKSAQEAALEWAVREVSEELPFKLKPEHHKGAYVTENHGPGRDSEHFNAVKQTSSIL